MESKKFIGGYLLRKRIIRKNHNFKQSHSAKNVKGGANEVFLTTFLLQNIKIGWPFGYVEDFRKCHRAEKSKLKTPR